MKKYNLVLVNITSLILILMYGYNTGVFQNFNFNKSSVYFLFGVIIMNLFHTIRTKNHK